MEYVVNFSKLGVVKFVATGIVGIGTGKIINSVIKAHITPETLIDKITVGLASAVMGAMATASSKKFVEQQIDEVVEFGNGVVHSIKVHTKLVRINDKGSTFEQEGLDEKDFVRNDRGLWVVRPDEQVQKVTLFATEVQNTD
jgi:hypothetical protein